jgi:hypothetical protein
LTDEDKVRTSLWHLLDRGAGKTKGNQLSPKLVRKGKKDKDYTFEPKATIKSAL